ncbi:MAG: hydrogenase maturation protease [Vicinamibacterales bacterium]
MSPLLGIVRPPLLIYGIGNVGRGDDGLGPLLVERLEREGVPPGVALEGGYQLAPEDALLLSGYDTVLFVDATKAQDAPAPYSVAPVEPSPALPFSTHVLDMGSVLALCGTLYGRAPRAFALAIPGYEFEVNASLSPGAESNLRRVLEDLHAALAAVTRSGARAS